MMHQVEDIKCIVDEREAVIADSEELVLRAVDQDLQHRYQGPPGGPPIQY